VFIVASNERCKLCCDGVIWVMATVLIRLIYENGWGLEDPLTFKGVAISVLQ
jgi:hypothetical protein